GRACGASASRPAGSLHWYTPVHRKPLASPPGIRIAFDRGGLDRRRGRVVPRADEAVQGGGDAMIRFALLGLLREQSDYGYGLKRRFDRRAGACWELNGGQVYQTLHALERAGFVAEVQEMAPSDSRRDRFPPRRMMTLTAKGARFHERWLRRAPVAP